MTQLLSPGVKLRRAIVLCSGAIQGAGAERGEGPAAAGASAEGKFRKGAADIGVGSGLL